MAKSPKHPASEHPHQAAAHHHDGIGGGSHLFSPLIDAKSLPVIFLLFFRGLFS
jgi:hypothetical protein